MAQLTSFERSRVMKCNSRARCRELRHFNLPEQCNFEAAGAGVAQAAVSWEEVIKSKVKRHVIFHVVRRTRGLVYLLSDM